jgi:hypothetical protein
MYKTLNGKKQHLKLWAKDYDIKYTTLCDRLRNGCPFIVALMTKPGQRMNIDNMVIPAIAKMQREVFMGGDYADQVI